MTETHDSGWAGIQETGNRGAALPWLLEGSSEQQTWGKELAVVIGLIGTHGCRPGRPLLVEAVGGCSRWGMCCTVVLNIVLLQYKVLLEPDHLHQIFCNFGSTFTFCGVPHYSQQQVASMDRAIGQLYLWASGAGVGFKKDIDVWRVGERCK